MLSFNAPSFFHTEILKNRLPLGSGQLPVAIVRISVSRNPNNPTQGFLDNSFINPKKNLQHLCCS